MAISSFNDNGIVSISIQYGNQVFTYKLTKGYKITNLYYENNYVPTTISSGIITGIDKNRSIIIIDNDKIVAIDDIIRIGNIADSVLDIKYVSHIDENGHVIAYNGTTDGITLTFGLGGVMHPNERIDKSVNNIDPDAPIPNPSETVYKTSNSSNKDDDSNYWSPPPINTQSRSITNEQELAPLSDDNIDELNTEAELESDKNLNINKVLKRKSRLFARSIDDETLIEDNPGDMFVSEDKPNDNMSTDNNTNYSEDVISNDNVFNDVNYSNEDIISDKNVIPEKSNMIDYDIPSGDEDLPLGSGNFSNNSDMPDDDKEEYYPNGYDPTDEIIDIREYEKIDPNAEKDIQKDVIYDKYIQKTSYIMANATAIFREWFLSFFRSNYFNMVRVRTESAYTAYKSFLKDIYKKVPPLLVIDNDSIEHVDDFIFGTNMINRYNIIDPNHDNIGAKILYSVCMFETERMQVLYRRERFRFKFDVLLMERSLDKSIDLYNYLLMNIRHTSKFMLFRRVNNKIPTHIIKSIARIHGFDVYSEEFLDWLNSMTIDCAIIKRVTTGGKVLFFASQECHVQVEVPDLPVRDSAEKSEAIEIAARVTDTFYFTIDLPIEFICTMDHSVIKQYESYQEGDDPDIHYIINEDSSYLDSGVKEIIGEYTLFNRLDVFLDNNDDNVIDIVQAIHDLSPELAMTATLLLNDDRIELPELLFKVRIIRNTEEISNFEVSYKGILTINNPDYTKMYHIYVYVNQKYLNQYTININTKKIGDIEKKDY